MKVVCIPTCVSNVKVGGGVELVQLVADTPRDARLLKLLDKLLRDGSTPQVVVETMLLRCGVAVPPANPG